MHNSTTNSSWKATREIRESKKRRGEERRGEARQVRRLSSGRPTSGSADVDWIGVMSWLIGGVCAIVIVTRLRHAYTLTRAKRWLSAQRRVVDVVVVVVVASRHCQSPAVSATLSPVLLSLAGKATSAPNCQRAKYILLFTPPLSFHASLPLFLHYISLRRIASRYPKFAARSHCRLNSLLCNIFFIIGDILYA